MFTVSSAVNNIPLKDKAPYKSKYALLLLLLIYVNNQWTRYLLNYLYAISSDDPYESIEAATGITSSQYGLLVGFGFGLAYVILGLFMGRAADLYNRVNIIFAGLFIWNSAIIIMGLATDFKALLISRILLGIGESFSGPAAYSLIADFFPPSRRAEANGIYAFGVYIGGGLGSLSLAMALSIGWRNTCYIAALSGIFLAILLRISVREPMRTTQDSSKAITADSTKLSLKQSLRAVCGRYLIVLLLIASSIRFVAGYIIGSYLPTFYSLRFPSDENLYSYLNASVVSIGGAMSSYLGGMIADKWLTSGERRANMYVPGIGAFVAIPALSLVMYSPYFAISIIALFFEYLLAECWFGPAMSALQGGLPPGARGVGIGVFSLVTTLSGSFAVWAVGLALEADDDNVSLVELLVLTGAGGAYALCSLVFFLAAQFVRPEGYTELPGSAENDE